MELVNFISQIVGVITAVFSELVVLHVVAVVKSSYVVSKGTVAEVFILINVAHELFNLRVSLFSTLNLSSEKHIE